MREAIAESLSMELRLASRDSHGSHDDGPGTVEATAAGSDRGLIGREDQLAQLEAAKTEFLAEREPLVAWITGLSGEGKSSLAEKFLDRLRLSDEVSVLSGRCYDRESVPFKAVDVLIEALVAFLRSRPDDQVHAWLPPDIHMLAQLFPALHRVQRIEDRCNIRISNIDDRQIRYRAFFALRELLVSISSETQLVLFIDDLQWGDADSAEVLADLLAPPNPPAVLLLGSYRSNDANDSPFLTEWHARVAAEGPMKQVTVKVSPLTKEQCLALLASRLGEVDDSLREQAAVIFQRTRGNPYFVEQLIEGADAENREFQTVPLNEVIDRRLERLPADAVSLLEAIAVAGQAVTVDEAAHVSEQSSQVFATMTHMRSERLVRLIGSRDQQRVDTYHDKIRETVLDGLDNARRRELHLGFGEFLEPPDRHSNCQDPGISRAGRLGQRNRAPCRRSDFRSGLPFSLRWRLAELCLPIDGWGAVLPVLRFGRCSRVP